jgi:hypothetical protein
MKMVSDVLNFCLTCSDSSTVDADDNGSDSQDVESQDEGDLGYGARPGGGFTSVVSVQSQGDIKLNYIVDNLKGNCTAQPFSGLEEAVGP